MITWLKRKFREWLLGDEVLFTLNNKKAQKPILAYGDEDACFDLYSVEERTIAGRTHAPIDCGISFEPPRDFEIQIRCRSGWGRKGIQIHFGTGDAGYRGSYGPIVYNHTDNPLHVNIGDRVCQVAIRPISRIKLTQKASLSSSRRGTSGWGSSGK